MPSNSWLNTMLQRSKWWIVHRILHMGIRCNLRCQVWIHRWGFVFQITDFLFVRSVRRITRLGIWWVFINLTLKYELIRRLVKYISHSTKFRKNHNIMCFNPCFNNSFHSVVYVTVTQSCHGVQCTFVLHLRTLFSKLMKMDKRYVMLW